MRRRLNQRDINRIIGRVINEQNEGMSDPCEGPMNRIQKAIGTRTLPPACMSSDMEDQCKRAVLGMLVNVMDPRKIMDAIMALKELIECRSRNSGEYY
jgi:hypothetical protein